MVIATGSVQDKPVHESHDKWEGGDANVEHGEHCLVPEGIARDLEYASDHVDEVVATPFFLRADGIAT